MLHAACDSDDEGPQFSKTPLLNSSGGASQDPEKGIPSSDDPIVLYLQRFWVAAVFSVLATLQLAVWNFYSPIEDSVKKVYGWDDDFISSCTNASTVAFILTVSLWSLSIDTYGPRANVLAAGLALAVSAVIRCLPVGNATHGGIVMVSMVLNGIAAPPIALCSPVISNNWFPLSERTTAVAVLSTMSFFGLAVGFILGPSMVPTHSDPEAARRSIEKVYVVEAVLCVTTLAIIAAHFPDKPPSPPSKSVVEYSTTASAKAGWWALARNPRAWVIFLAMGVPSGVYQGWSMVLDFNLHDMGISENNAAWIGFWQVISGCIAGISIARASDQFAGNLKCIIICVYGLATVAFLYLAAEMADLVPKSLPLTFVCCIIAGGLMNATTPLFYELAVESFYPMGPGLIVGFMELTQMVVQAIFNFLPMDQLGTRWMNWIVFAFPPFFCICLIFWEERYERLEQDQEQLRLLQDRIWAKKELPNASYLENVEGHMPGSPPVVMNQPGTPPVAEPSVMKPPLQDFSREASRKETDSDYTDDKSDTTDTFDA